MAFLVPYDLKILQKFDLFQVLTNAVLKCFKEKLKLAILKHKKLWLHTNSSFAYLLRQAHPVLLTFWTDYVTCWMVMTN